MTYYCKNCGNRITTDNYPTHGDYLCAGSPNHLLLNMDETEINMHGDEMISFSDFMNLREVHNDD